MLRNAHKLLASPLPATVKDHSIKIHLTIFTFLAMTLIFEMTTCISVFIGLYGKKNKTTDKKTIARY
jgi:hypothetical protein